jgi:hypothetical protein
MNVTGQTKIFRKDFNGRPAYSRRISSQEYKNGQKGDWINLYESVQMPKNTDIPDGCIIEVSKGFEAVYNGKNGVQRKLVVQQYKVLDAPRQSQKAYEQPPEPSQEFTALDDDDIPF